jgi:hypothetical protein
VVAGTGISVSGATGAVTISSSGGAGTVTSVATGNGLTGGTITTSGTATQSSNNSLTGYATASNTYTYFRIIVTNLIGNGTYGATSDGTLSDSLLQFGWTPTFNVTTSTPYSWVGIFLEKK